MKRRFTETFREELGTIYTRFVAEKEHTFTQLAWTTRETFRPGADRVQGFLKMINATPSARGTVSFT